MPDAAEKLLPSPILGLLTLLEAESDPRVKLSRLIDTIEACVKLLYAINAGRRDEYCQAEKLGIQRPLFSHFVDYFNSGSGNETTKAVEARNSKWKSLRNDYRGHGATLDAESARRLVEEHSSALDDLKQALPRGLRLYRLIQKCGDKCLGHPLDGRAEE